MLNGFWLKPKKALYITGSGSVGLFAFYHAMNNAAKAGGTVTTALQAGNERKTTIPLEEEELHPGAVRLPAEPWPVSRQAWPVFRRAWPVSRRAWRVSRRAWLLI